jgi:hypothetical protein
VSLEAVRRGMLWLLLTCSCIGFIEPSPYEIAFVMALALFALSGMRLSVRLVPLVMLLLLYNLGGAISLIPWLEEEASVRFIAVSIYLMITAIFFAAIMADDTLARLRAIRRGYLVAAWVAGAAGIAGYFDIGGSGSLLSLYGRASGTFKDPNVLGPFLVLPIIWGLQRVLVGRLGLASGMALISLPLLGLFLTFSRGAWGNLVGAALLTMALLFLTSQDRALRARIVAFGVICVAMAIAGLGIALSFERIREVFEIRASLDQSYDQGVTGRFGNQLRSLSALLDRPNGFGPLRFRWVYADDPHNVYVNAFASYGWLGGISFLGLTVATCIAGWRLALRSAPWQGDAIAIWAVLFVTILQGLQIDTDHWRHLFLMIGLVWGLSVLPVPGTDRLGQSRSLRTTT